MASFPLGEDRRHSCLLSGHAEPPSVVKEYRIVGPPRSGRPDIALSLQGLWGSETALDFDAPANTVWLTSGRSKAASPSWTFVPSPEILAIITDRLKALAWKRVNAPWHLVYPNGQENSFVYIPLSHSAQPLKRHSRETQDRECIVPKSDLPPYNDHSLLHCAAHPYFVIYGALQAFARVDVCAIVENWRVFAALSEVRLLREHLKELPVDARALHRVLPLPLPRMKPPPGQEVDAERPGVSASKSGSVKRADEDGSAPPRKCVPARMTSSTLIQDRPTFDGAKMV